MTETHLWKSLVLTAAIGTLAGCGSTVYRERVVYEAPPPEPVVVVQQPVVIERPPEVVVSTFHDDLSPYGEWVVIGSYGRCWRPRGVVGTWRPYTVGHWAWSDYGWTWVSEEPWGFACYHYGRWFEDPHHGWVWIPGSTWAPAWVAWRSGGGYVGWAPLGPSTVVAEASVTITERQTEDIAPSAYVFVEERDLPETRVDRRVVNIQQNTTIINKTTNITNITVVNKKVVNKSVSVEKIERDTGRKVQRTSVKEVASADEARRGRERGETVAYRPRPLVNAPPPEKVTLKDQEAAPLRRDRGNRPTEDRRRDAEREKAAEAQRLEAERAKAAETKRLEAERAKAAEAKRLEAERAKALEAKRLEAERAKAAEAKRLEVERAKATEAKRLEAERAKAAEAKRLEAERAKAAEAKRLEAERAKAAENKRLQEERAREGKREPAKPGRPASRPSDEKPARDANRTDRNDRNPNR